MRVVRPGWLERGATAFAEQFQADLLNGVHCCSSCLAVGILDVTIDETVTAIRRTPRVTGPVEAMAHQGGNGPQAPEKPASRLQARELSPKRGEIPCFWALVQKFCPQPEKINNLQAQIKAHHKKWAVSDRYCEPDQIKWRARSSINAPVGANCASAGS
jgi:hypothetical protein